MRAKKQDGNHAEVVKWLRDHGYSVAHVHGVGNGFPDLLAGKNGKNFLIEVKDGKPRFTQPEVEFHASWRGQLTTVCDDMDLIDMENGISVRFRYLHAVGRATVRK